MKIARKLGMFFIVAGALLTALVVSVRYAIDCANELTVAQERRLQAYMLADELRQSSDDLTRMVRSYVVTGDKKFIDYFHHISRVRDGLEPTSDRQAVLYWDLIPAPSQNALAPPSQPSLMARLHQAAVTADEHRLLALAKIESDRLIQIEMRAMALMDDYFNALSIGDMAEAIKRREQAMQLTFDQDYHHAKSRIMSPIDQFNHLVEQRTDNYLHDMRERQRHSLWFAAAISGLLLLFSVVTFFYMRYDIISPLQELMSWVDHVRQASYQLQPKTLRDDEFGQLESAFIAMAEQIGAKIQELETQAAQDSLTGVATLRRGQEFLALCIRMAERGGGRIAVLFVDFDAFKPINDHYGHAMGDQVLAISAQRMRDALRVNDLVCRIGGDEFIVVLPDIPDRDTAERMADKLQSVVAEPMVINGVSLSTSISVGIALYPDNGNQAAALISAADQAMYQRKPRQKPMVT